MNVGALALELLDFFLPSVCIGCQDHTSLERSADLVCQACRTRLREVPPPRCGRCGFPLGSKADHGDRCAECSRWDEALSGARSAVVLRPPANRIVHGLKYGVWSELARFMGDRMVRWAIPPDLHSGRYVVVPIPTTKRRMRARGYNQARLLASALSGAVHNPLVDALERSGNSSTQVGLHPTQRRANVTGVFSVRADASARVSGVRVLLVDDVLTTGSTAQAAALPLVRAGASQVFLSTFARAFPYV